MYPSVQGERRRSLRLYPSVQGSQILLPINQAKILVVFPPIANTYQFYKFYQIKKGKVPSLQTDEPLVIIDTLGSGILQQASGFDIRVFDSSGNPIPYERRLSTRATGDIRIWLNQSVIKDSEFVQLTFGKPTATDGQNPAGVWDPKSNMVLHMDPSLLDSSSHNNDAINSLTFNTGGKIGQARLFGGLSFSFLEVADSASLNINGTKLRLSAWLDSTDPDGMIISKENFVSGIRPYSIRRLNGKAVFSLHTTVGGISELTGTIPLSDTEFDYIVATYDGSDMKIFVNGKFDSSIPKTGNIRIDPTPLFLGKRSDDTAPLSGIIDEPRVSAIVPTADLIKTEFNNQNDNDAFWFKTKLFENGEDIFLKDDDVQERNIVAVLS